MSDTMTRLTDAELASELATKEDLLDSLVEEIDQLWHDQFDRVVRKAFPAAASVLIHAWPHGTDERLIGANILTVVDSAGQTLASRDDDPEEAVREASERMGVDLDSVFLGLRLEIYDDQIDLGDYDGD